MKQCKLCVTPLGKEPTTDELDNHWKKITIGIGNQTKKKHPKKHYLKNKIKRRLGVVIVYSMPRPLNEGVNNLLGSRYKRSCHYASNICLIEMKK